MYSWCIHSVPLCSHALPAPLTLLGYCCGLLQSVLVVDALALAVEFLAPGGTFVTKASGSYSIIL
jgi:hypothetical protein